MRHLSPDQREAAAEQTERCPRHGEPGGRYSAVTRRVIATLSSDTLLAPKFVALSAGTPDGETLANNAIIEGHPAYGIAQITAAAGPLVDNANKLIDNLNGTVSNLDGTVTSVETTWADSCRRFRPLIDIAKTDLESFKKS